MSRRDKRNDKRRLTATERASRMLDAVILAMRDQTPVGQLMRKFSYHLQAHARATLDRAKRRAK